MNMNTLLLFVFESAICATAISMDGFGNEPDQADLMDTAIWRRDEELVQHLLANGADPNGLFHNRSHLFQAVSVGHEGVVRALLAAPCIDPNFSPGHLSPLYQATYEGKESIVGMLLAAPGIDPNGSPGYHSPLYQATYNGNESIVGMLLAAPGIDPNGGPLDRKSPLFQAVEKGLIDTVRNLLNAPGINPNYGGNNESPLMGEARYGHEEIFRILNDAPVDSPLLEAARRGQVDTVRILLNAPGINPNCRGLADGRSLCESFFNDSYGRYNQRQGQIFGMLLDAGAVIEPVDVEFAATNLPQGNHVQSTVALFEMVSMSNELFDILNDNASAEHDRDVLLQQGASATAKFASHNNLSAIELVFKQGHIDLSRRLFHNVLMKSLKEAFHEDDFSMVQTLARTCTAFNTEQVVGGSGLLSVPIDVRSNIFCSALPEDLRMKITNVRYAMKLLASSEASSDHLDGLNLPYALLQQFRMLFDLLQGYHNIFEIRPAIQMMILDIFPKSSLEDDYEFSKLLMRLLFVACDSRSPVHTKAIPETKESVEVCILM